MKRFDPTLWDALEKEKLPEQAISFRTVTNTPILSGVTVSPEGWRGLILFSKKHHKVKSNYKNLKLTTKQIKGEYVYLLYLIEPSLEEYFEILCSSIFEIFEEAKEDIGPRLLEKQLSHWASLLSSSLKKLNEEAERGLFAELEIFKYYLTKYSVSDVLTAWTGPTGTDQDFHFENFLVEVKSRYGSAEGIKISSFNQLDASGSLFLAVVSIEDDASGSTLEEQVDSVAKAISEEEPICTFNHLLAQVGYNESMRQVGTKKRYKVMDLRFFKANESGFPSVRASQFPPGIVNGSYTITYVALTPFMVEGVDK